MSAQVLLFACSKCFSRHPFEDLSSGQQLCKDCAPRGQMVKCSYCRSEFQQTSSKSTGTICKKCEQNLKTYGKPNACENCNIMCAFGGSKCQRCQHLEAKYGPAVSCDQCKLRCAFNKHDDNKKDGRVLCWLCTVSLKRAMAKAHKVEVERRMAKKRSHADSNTIKENNGNSSSLKISSSRGNGTTSSGNDLMSKPPLPDINPEKVRIVSADHNNSDHVVAITQLKETIASLQKKLNMKDKELLEKDKQITELKAKNFTAETEMRNKMKESDRLYETKIDILNKKIANMLKEIATLTRTNKKLGAGTLAKDSGSGTDSPVTN